MQIPPDHYYTCTNYRNEMAIGTVRMKSEVAERLANHGGASPTQRHMFTVITMRSCQISASLLHQTSVRQFPVLYSKYACCLPVYSIVFPFLFLLNELLKSAADLALTRNCYESKPATKLQYD